ncbi:MAG: hypothetical protein H0T39_11150 [Actinobacteria bacterium]|nr:hypothetical protein [Actinomycetota bacterium]
MARVAELGDDLRQPGNERGEHGCSSGKPPCRIRPGSKDERAHRSMRHDLRSDMQKKDDRLLWKAKLRCKTSGKVHKVKEGRVRAPRA